MRQARGAPQVLSGARVPADGEVVEGRSHVDESMVTGESKPATKRPGDGLISGTVNCSGPLVMKVCCWHWSSVLNQLRGSADLPPLPMPSSGFFYALTSLCPSMHALTCLCPSMQGNAGWRGHNTGTDSAPGGACPDEQGANPGCGGPHLGRLCAHHLGGGVRHLAGLVHCR